MTELCFFVVLINFLVGDLAVQQLSLMATMGRTNEAVEALYQQTLNTISANYFWAIAINDSGEN